MNAPREIDDAPVAGMPRGRPHPMPAAAAHGAARAFTQTSRRARRPCLPDEERRLLREAEAAFEGSDRRHDADTPVPSAWDQEEEKHSDAVPSRLFRD